MTDTNFIRYNKGILGRLKSYSKTLKNEILNHHKAQKPMGIYAAQQKHTDKHLFVHTVRKIICSNCVKGTEGGREGGGGARAVRWLKFQPNHKVKSTKHGIKDPAASRCKRAAYTRCDRANMGGLGIRVNAKWAEDHDVSDWV